jgi:hypothetical protein
MTRFAQQLLVAFALLQLPALAAGQEVGEAQSTSQPRLIERRAAPPGVDQPLLMTTGQDALTVCGDRQDTARGLVCFAWITGASADNGWTQSLESTQMPDWCAGGRSYSLGERRDLFVAHLRQQTVGALSSPAIIHFRAAMAKAFPCKQGTLKPAG